MLFTNISKQGTQTESHIFNRKFVTFAKKLYTFSNEEKQSV